MTATSPPETPVGNCRPPRWPWVVGVTAIVAAIALVASVSLLVTRTDTENLTTPTTTTTIAPPVQDQITTTPPPPRRPRRRPRSRHPRHRLRR